jgi:hypothetical protein
MCFFYHGSKAYIGKAEETYDSSVEDNEVEAELRKNKKRPLLVKN